MFSPLRVFWELHSFAVLSFTFNKKSSPEYVSKIEFILFWSSATEERRFRGMHEYI